MGQEALAVGPAVSGPHLKEGGGNTSEHGAQAGQKMLQIMSTFHETRPPPERHTGSQGTDAQSHALKLLKCQKFQTFLRAHEFKKVLRIPPLDFKIPKRFANQAAFQKNVPPRH